MSDQLFCLLMCCMKGITTDKLVYGIYLLQYAGFDLKYRFTVQQNGVRCRLLNSYMDEVLDMRYLHQKDDKLIISSKGEKYVEKYILNIEEWEKLDYIMKLIDMYNTDELHFYVLVNIIYSETTKVVKNTTKILKLKSQISEAIFNVYGEYTQEEFDRAFEIIRNIKYNKKEEVKTDEQ